ncbi:hypothetical protein QL285_065483 [Trifolium repens]|nr:hypothetical protein QL285_065483 [Trifolium repens]
MALPRGGGSFAGCGGGGRDQSCTFVINFLHTIDMLRDTRHEVEDLDMLERIRLTIINNPPHYYLVSMMYKFL